MRRPIFRRISAVDRSADGAAHQGLRRSNVAPAAQARRKSRATGLGGRRPACDKIE